jgi:large subunit ribosomal protein L14
MISLLTTVQIIDNSGGIVGRCIKILKPHNRNYGKLGDLILVSILKTIPSSKIRKGEVYKATIVRTKTGNISFDTNAVMLVKTSPKTTDLTPIGSSIKGVLPIGLKYKRGCSKLLALAGVKRTIY